MKIDTREALARLHRSEDVSALPAAVPYARFLGLQVSQDAQGLLVRMPGAEHLIGNPVLPALHGGTVGALMESTAIFQLLWEIPLVAVPKTINLTVDYLRSGRVVETTARARITKHGRRVANVHVSAFQDDEARPIAGAHAHFLLKNA